MPNPAILLGFDYVSPALRLANGSMGAIDQSAQHILQVPELQIPGVPQYAGHLAMAQTNAGFWQSNLRPEVLQAVNAIMTYGQAYSIRTAVLINDAQKLKSDPVARSDLNQRLAALQTQVNTSEQQAQHITDGVNAFQERVAQDARNFNGDGQQAQSVLQSEQAQQDALRREIDGLNRQITEAEERKKYYWLGGPLLKLLLDAIDDLTTDRSNAEQRLSQYSWQSHQTQSQIAALNIGIASISQLVNGVNTLYGSLTVLSQSWSGLKESFDQLSQYLRDNVNPDSVFLVAQINTAQALWADIVRQAQQIT